MQAMGGIENLKYGTAVATVSFLFRLFLLFV